MTPAWTPALTTLRRAVLYRAGLGLVLILADVWDGSTAPDPLGIFDLAVATAVVVAVGIFVLVRIRIGASPFRLALVLTAGDFLAATYLIWLSGPVDGPMVFLFPLTVVATSFLLGPGASYYAAAAAFFLQGAGHIAVGQLAGTIAIRELILSGLLLVALAALADGLTTRLHQHHRQARRQARTMETLTALAEEVIERSDTGLLAVDRTGQILLSNPEARRFLDPAPEAVGASQLQRRAPDLYAIVRAWRRGRAADTGELNATPAQTSSNPLAYRLIPLGASGGEATLIHLYDLNEARERRRAQERTERLAALGRLSANLAHEIRNPLSSIQQAAQLLEESGANERLTGIIRSETERMNQWVATLLGSLRPATGEARSLRLADALASAAQLLRSEVDSDTGPDLDWSVTPQELRACMDEGHLHQVLWNLGVNAIRHGGAAGVAEIRMRAFPKEPARVRIEVQDNGPGIPNAEQERIFEPFFTTAADGNGLGLGLVRELVEASGGQITVQNRPEGGACFAVDLPRACTHEGEEAT